MFLSVQYPDQNVQHHEADTAAVGTKRQKRSPTRARDVPVRRLISFVNFFQLFCCLVVCLSISWPTFWVKYRESIFFSWNSCVSYIKTRKQTILSWLACSVCLLFSFYTKFPLELWYVPTRKRVCCWLDFRPALFIDPFAPAQPPRGAWANFPNSGW